jgi:hypothetical protein
MAKLWNNPATWDLFFDGQERRLRKGFHFTMPVAAFLEMVESKAKERDVAIQYEVQDKVVVLKALLDE